MQSTASTPSEQAALDAEAQYRRAQLISNIGFIVGGLFLFLSLWYIVGKGTPFDLSVMLGSVFGSEKVEQEGTPAYLKGLELDPIDPKQIPPIFLDEAPPPPTSVSKEPTKAVEKDDKEERLQKALAEANHQFRSWQFLQSEKSYMSVIKVLPKERALKLQVEVCNMFFKRGVRFYKEKRYSKAVEVLRIALHFDSNNRLAHKYLARCYRLLGKGSKAKYHERMVKKLKK